MRWIVLALSLGAAIMSMIHGVLGIIISSNSATQTAAGVSTGSFNWWTGVMLVTTSIMALLGGVLGFNKRRISAVFLLIPAALCFYFNNDTLIYAGLYLVAGLMAIFLRRSSAFDDDGYDDEEYEDDGEDISDDDDVPEVDENPVPRRMNTEKRQHVSLGSERGERTVRARVSGNEEYAVPVSSSRAEPARVRTSKVCPSCGATVGIDYKFCYVCGTPLHTNERPSVSEADSPEQRRMIDEILTAPSDPVQDVPATPKVVEPDFTAQSDDGKEPIFAVEDTSDGPSVKDVRPDDHTSSGAAFKLDDFQAVTPMEVGSDDGDDVLDSAKLIDKIMEEDVHDNRGFRPTENVKYVEPVELDEDNEDTVSIDPDAIPSPRKVFVKPVRDKQPSARRSISIDPDNSYQEFSNYARRRKRKNQSLPRRILGVALLLLVVGGVSWFLLSLRKVPPTDLPEQLPQVVENKEQPQKPQTEPQVIAQPNDGQNPMAGTDELPKLEVEAPTRGVVTGTNVNLRSEHSTASSVVTRLTNAKVELLDSWESTSGALVGTWYKVRSGTREGWIFGRYLLPLNGKETSLPSGYTAQLLRSFGTSKSGMTESLGRPSKRTASTLSWQGLTATFKGDSEVVKLQLTNGQRSLKNGVSFGMTDDTLYRTIGYPSDIKGGQLRYLESSNRGMLIRLRDGKVQSVTVGNI